jgi:hypothetical protein
MIIFNHLALDPGSTFKRCIAALAVHGWFPARTAHWLIQVMGLVHA